jgi:hypothetical protein
MNTEVSEGTKKILNLVQAVNDFMHEEKLYDPHSDPIVYHDPEEWRNRGEIYGLDSELVMVYEGNAMFYIMNPGYSSHPSTTYKLHDRFIDKVHEAGFWVEPCTGWYAAFYPTEG